MNRKTAIWIGIALFIFSARAWAGRPVPDTGQTKCYDTEGVEISCTGTGQDAAYTINPMSFTKLDAAGRDLPDDAADWVMVRDNVTGLIWEVKQNKDGVEDYANPHDADNTYTWYDPNPETNGGNAGTPSANDTLDFVSSLNDDNFGGYHDWRMPTIEELRSIVNYNFPEPDPTITPLFFPNCNPARYYSSSSSAYDPACAWTLSFEYGNDHTNDVFNLKSNVWYVRAVRGGHSWSLDHLVDNADGTVTDRRTGIMWEQKTDDGGDRDKDNAYAWDQALDYCGKLILNGHTDWRLPTIKELGGIADLGKYNPSIDTGFFPNAVVSYTWSSSTYINFKNRAWGIRFDFGRDDAYLKLNNEFLALRAVRGGQPRLPDHLFISEPRQASNWNIGSVMPITWDTAGIGGNVTISLSRDGGKPGTYVDLTTTDNDGYHEWTVTGPATVNGYLKITPLNDTAKATSNGLFSIEDYIIVDNKNPTDLTINETPGSNNATFRIRLTQAPVPDTEVRINLYSSHTNQCTVSPAAVLLDESNWSGGAVVTVTGVDDDQLDGDYTCTIRTDPVESTDPDYRGMITPDVTVTVQDDETPPVLTVDSVDPNLVAVNQSFSLTIRGSGLSAGVVTDALLVLQREDGQPDWNHRRYADLLTPMGTELVADFSAADMAGPYLLRVVYGAGFEEVPGAVTVESDAFLQEVEGKRAILVAGRENSTDPLWPAIRDNANHAYKTLRFRGFSGENIHYLTHMANIDVDGDGKLDRDGTPFRTALRDAIIGSFTEDADELILYMVDHGGDRLFNLAERNTVTAGDLKDWLDQLQKDRAMRVIVIIDACMSGSFVEALTPGIVHPDSERIVIASAGPENRAWFMDEGSQSFSRYFWDTAYTTGRLFRSFISGRDHMAVQNPQVDRTGDGIADEITLAALTGGTLQEILIGREGLAGPGSPEIGYACFGGACNAQAAEETTRDLGCADSVTISASEVVFFNGRLRVFAQLIPPEFEYVSSEEPVNQLPTIDLEDPEEDGTYTGNFTDLDRTGVYRILVYATDKHQDTSVPKILKAVRTCGLAPQKGDINVDLETDLIDAIIALKVLAGIDVPGQIRADYATSGVDVDGLNQVDMAEAVYGLQKAAEIR